MQNLHTPCERPHQQAVLLAAQADLETELTLYDWHIQTVYSLSTVALQKDSRSTHIVVEACAVEKVQTWSSIGKDGRAR